MSYNIIIAGAGGIGQAAGLLLAVNTEFSCQLYIGDMNQAALDASKKFIEEGAIESASRTLCAASLRLVQ